MVSGVQYLIIRRVFEMSRPPVFAVCTVSIDSPPLLLGWLIVAHLILKSILPMHYALTATVGYASAGLGKHQSRIYFAGSCYFHNSNN